MNDNDKLRIGALAAAAVLVPLLVQLLFEPATWIVVTTMVLGAVALFAAAVKVHHILEAGERELRSAQFRMDEVPQPLPEPQPAPEEVRWEDKLTGVPVPSAEPDYPFIVSATVRWAYTHNGRHPIGDPAAVVKRMVLERICAVTAARQPVNPLLLQHEIAAEMSTPRPDVSGALVGWAEQVTLTLDKDDAERLAKLAALRKEELVWEHERRFEISKRDYLGNDVLKSTGSAVVWRLAQDHHKVIETVDMIDTISQLTAAANDDSVPALSRRLELEPSPVSVLAEEDHLWSVPAAPEPPVKPGLALVEEMFPQTESGQRDLFLDQLAELIRKHDRHDIADQLCPDRKQADSPVEPLNEVIPDLDTGSARETPAEPPQPDADPDRPDL
ncbi:hypothetical protein [Actinokineospora iranica]|uniref:Uncharacterized protein n=1 Tax=Actinokineospora iranica TaxID=1271860 RepID=A0A1G6TM05_9PSEU|nr:hypothetical protein [Actinokineospora iranica]SDD30059.1 hypothetical protein SAMN05216174_109211 [Actinokineospora iranica]